MIGNLFYTEENTGRNVKVLIVEDSGIVGLQIKHVLISMNYSVVDIVTSGEMAIEVAEEKRIDLVLMDIKLDGRIDGIDAANVLRQKYNLPVIFLTAYSDEETFKRAKITEPFAYILKPFESKDLKTAIEIAMYKHNIERQLKQSEELYRTLVQTTHDGIIILYNGKIEFVNEAYTKMFGFRNEEITGTLFRNLIDREISTVLDEHFKRIAQNDPMQSEYEIDLFHKDGQTVKTVNINLNTAAYQNRKIVVCTIKDITENKKAREILKRSEENLKAKLEYILSSDEQIEKINLLEIIDRTRLQEIQDTFAESFNIASAITDVFGNPITQPSNFSNYCCLIRSSSQGMLNCIHSDKFMGYEAKEKGKPIIAPCKSGGLIDAVVPLFVANQHIGNWHIGQVNISGTGSVVKTDSEYIKKYATEIGVDAKILTEEFTCIQKMESTEFNKITKLLFLFAQEISSLAYSNLVLRKELFHRKKTENALQRSEVKNEVILSAIPDAMFQVNSNGDYICLKISNIADDYFWYGNKTKKQKVKDDFPEEIADLILKNVKMTIATGNAQMFEFSYDSSDHLHFYEARVALLDGDESLIMIRDITEKKNSEKEIIKAKEKAENSDRLKSEFLAQMSHEIRTPINAILSFSSLLKEELEDKLSGGLAESFKIIDKAGRRLIRTIDEILEMSQLQTGNYEFHSVAVDLAKEVMENLLAEYYYLAKEKHINLKFENKIGDDAHITADKHMINQIFSNLIDNAIKYTPEGEIMIIQYKNEQEKLCVQIKDTGIGISEEYLPQLFTPFSQEESGYTRRYEGNGLGLAIVKKYVELNNAKILVKSEKGKGSVFTVIFEK